MDDIEKLAEKLNENDKAELRQFINNQNQKARVYGIVHTVTEICFQKCITSASSMKKGKLDKGEESCLANCTDRFMDVTNVAMEQLQTAARANSSQLP